MNNILFRIIIGAVRYICGFLLIFIMSLTPLLLVIVGVVMVFGMDQYSRVIMEPRYDYAQILSGDDDLRYRSHHPTHFSDQEHRHDRHKVIYVWCLY